MRLHPRGFALLLVLAMMAILTMMLTGLFTAVGGPSVASTQSLRQTCALFAAEAGLQEVLVELQASKSWSGKLNRSLASGTGNYTVDMTPTVSPTSLHSINNLSSSTPAKSYRGADTVPAKMVLIVVRAQSGGLEQRLEVLAAQGEQLAPNTALLSGGRIRLQGDVHVSGIKSMADPSGVKVDVHSNMATGTGLLTWAGTGSEQAYIDGDVSSVGSATGAISLASGATVTGDNNPGATARSLPSFNIVSTIASKNASPAPPLTPLGLSTLPAGEYYHSGDLEVNGDLDLQGAKLYVAGKLKVNGSVRGQGALYVEGDTSLQGDSEVMGHDSQGVALLSHGDVTLTGFDGNGFLSAVGATDSAFNTWKNQATDTLMDLKAELQSPARSLISGWNHTNMSSFIQVLGPFTSGTTHEGYENQVLDKMAGKLTSLPVSGDPAQEATRNFMVKRLNAMSHMFKGGGTHLGGDDVALTNFLATGDPGAAFDAAVDEQYSADPTRAAKAHKAWPTVKTLIDAIDYNKLGRSYFQGLVYTDGNFNATNDLTVIGAMAVRGDVNLQGGVRVTYVKSMFEPGGVTSWSGRVQVVSWLTR